MAAGDTIITIVGRLTDDPELRYTPQGAAVANFTVAANPRIKNRDGQWEDGPASFHNCSVWQQQAENVAATFHKGHRVMLSGTLHQTAYTTKDGENRRRWEVKVEEIGPTVRFTSVTIPDSPAGKPRPQREQPADPWANTSGEAPF